MALCRPAIFVQVLLSQITYVLSFCVHAVVLYCVVWRARLVELVHIVTAHSSGNLRGAFDRVRLHTLAKAFHDHVAVFIAMLPE